MLRKDACENASTPYTSILIFVVLVYVGTLFTIREVRTSVKLPALVIKETILVRARVGRSSAVQVIVVLLVPIVAVSFPLAIQSSP